VFTNYKMSMRVRVHLRPASRGERGYILLTLILAVALLAIAAVIVAPTIAFQMKRDREEELIHRGVQYSRAIKHYVKKFGRYPTKIEDLEKTNEIRFLRKRYKDPINGKDFKILRMGDVQLLSAGATPGNPLAPGGPQGPGGAGAQANPAAGALAGGFATTGINSGPGGLNQNPGGAGTILTPVGSNGAGGEDSEETDAEDANSNGPNAGPAQKVTNSVTSQGPLGETGTGDNPQVFGGGPMVGVASTSKDKTIRVFNKKDHYYQWQFIYDPSTDTGGLLTTPTAGPPPLTPITNQNGVSATPGTNGATTGQPPSPGAQPPPTGMQPPQIPPDENEQ
jgi:type II secretory pathway pseudopilin PulG